jgi:hypothetical protein
MAYVLGTSLVHSVIYCGQNGMQLYWQRTGLFEKYKMHRTPIMKPPAELIQRSLRDALIAQCLIGPLSLYFIYPVVKSFGTSNELCRVFQTTLTPKHAVSSANTIPAFPLTDPLSPLRVRALQGPRPCRPPCHPR